jgi:agmatinase
MPSVTGGSRVVGVDVVEVAPAYDHAEVTALAAATVIFDMIALLARRRKG